jgi:hypothetical protein
MKAILLASAVAASLFVGLPSAAQADTKIRIYLGVPHYTYQVGPEYVYRRGYGWYRPAGVVRSKMSCNQAKNHVRNRGYRNVSTIECGGATYTFRGTRNGNKIRIFVNARTGGVWRG